MQNPNLEQKNTEQFQACRHQKNVNKNTKNKLTGRNKNRRTLLRKAISSRCVDVIEIFY